MKRVTVGVLLDADFDYGVGVLDGVRDFARVRPDWRVLPIPYSQEGLLTRLVRADELHGVVGSLVSDRWFQSRFPCEFPMINTSNLSRVENVGSVVPDDEAAGRLVARHFFELGYLHAGVVAERATYASQMRRDGFMTFMREHGVTVTEPCGTAAYRYETGWQEWLAALRQETAVFCTSDHLACRFWGLCKSGDPSGRTNIAALAGVGDSLTDRVVSGLDLTSVALPARAVGLKAAERLARVLTGERLVVREWVPPVELVVRGSTARFASADEVVARAMGLAIQTLAENPGVAEVARRVGVSRRTLELRFHAAFGHGPAEEFRERRLELAKRLLVETDLTIAEVAARTGGGSVQAFTTLVRHACGCPPAAFRKRSQTLQHLEDESSRSRERDG